MPSGMPWPQRQTLLHCIGYGCYLGLNDPGVLANACCGECVEEDEKGPARVRCRNGIQQLRSDSPCCG